MSRPWCAPIVAITLSIAPAVGTAQQLFEGRRAVILEGAQARLSIDLLGGSVVEFRFRDQDLNPLRWANAGPADQARSMSHFLCLDRWGLPSEAEAANGMQGHGEATKVPWQVLSEKPLEACMAADLPMAGLRVERTLRLAPDAAWFDVSETVTNRNRLGRVYNMVQHATIGPPFLDESVLVDSNATTGFAQGGQMPNPEHPSFVWPGALRDRELIDMRRLADNHDPNVVSYVIQDEIGWTTAANPSLGLLIGYIWKRQDYPWLNMWRRSEDGKPLARGLEFGTTGLHQPFPVLVKKGRIFGQPLLDFLDAGENHTRTYVGFLAKIPARYAGVASVTRLADELILVERGQGRTIRVPIPAEALP